METITLTLSDAVRNINLHFNNQSIAHHSFSLIADKWTLLILMSLVQGTKRTNQIQRQVEGISPKMLAQTLKKLEELKFITRKVYPEVPPKVEYSLTEFGSSLTIPLNSLLEWSRKHESTLRTLYQSKKIN
jgi:DNA-binding HxlR family transcriptional regulator